jgi:LysR family glycine cleavage system transcriptional activator
MIDWRTLPPLSALRAFAALAEAGSASAAGARLGVSHAAISQQVRSLEAHMGLTLVNREGRRLTMTPEGRQLADALEEGFGAIWHSVSALTGADADRPLQVSTTHLFAQTWLMPRLPAFQERHPEVDIMLHPSAELVDPAPGGVDLCLRFGDGDWPGLEAVCLLPTDIVITAAPDLVKDRVIAEPRDLLPFPWLQELGTNESEDWLRKHGVTEGRARSVTSLPGTLMLEAARAGQGIMSSTRSAVEADLRAGSLRILFRDRGDTGYYIVTRPGILRPPAKAFVAWLRRQAGN